MGHVHARVAEGDAGEGGGVHHLVARFVVAGIVDGALQVQAQAFQRRFAADVAPGIGALAHRPQRRFAGCRAPRVGLGGIGLERVRQHIEAAGRDYILRQRVSDGRVDQRQRRFQTFGCDAGFTCRASKSKMVMPVHSEPVPQVVGQAICGLSGPGTGLPAPMGALT